MNLKQKKEEEEFEEGVIMKYLDFIYEKAML